MHRIRLPLAAFSLFLLAACQSAAPTAPLDSRARNAPAAFDTDSIVGNEAADGGTMIGSGN